MILISTFPDRTIDIGRNARRLPTKGPGMFKSQRYRIRAAEYGEPVKSSTEPDGSREFGDLPDRLAPLADEEEHVLRCLGAAVIMQWNALPTALQREIFDTAGSASELLETAALRAQIARFLHKHKNDAGRDKS
jgi:hypothetical protein